jgi:hypothetical protein
LFDDPADVFGHDQPSARAGSGKEYLLGVSRNPKRQLLSPNLRAPTWVEIANTPGVTEAALFLMLTTPHAGMPMFLLSPEQRQEIIDYILSLKSGN